MVFEKLKNLTLVPEQQSSVDSSVRMNQWALSHSWSQQPFSAMCKRLICSINANLQAATILIVNGDFIMDHRLDIKKATTTAAQGAFLPIRERYLFQLDPQNTVMPELDPTYQGLLFPDLSLEDPDLESIIGDDVSPEMKIMILAAVKESQANNQLMVQLLDAKARRLYSSATG